MKKKKIFLIVVALALFVVAAVSYRDVLVRYHLHRYGTEYRRVLSPDTSEPLRFRHRAYALYHCEKLIELGYWGRYIFPIFPMEQAQMQAFCELLTNQSALEPSYSQNWNITTPAGPKGTLAVWCRPDKVEGWKQFLKEHNILKEDEKTNNEIELIP